MNSRKFRSRFIILTIILLLFIAPSVFAQHEEITIYIGELSIEMKFRLIPAGSFMMGSPPTESDRHGSEGPVHEVTISKDFYIGKFEVTQAQWLAVMMTSPSIYKGFNKPVENVSWDDAVNFCQKLSQMTGEKFRLPTEAEWEYAARAGTTTKYYWGESDDNAGQYAWYQVSSTRPVGQKLPNNWGLYDMSGNVWEWCTDWHGSYSAESVVDPQGPQRGKSRVLRGGSWYRRLKNVRSACRFGVPATYGTNFDIGFRVVREVR